MSAVHDVTVLLFKKYLKILENMDVTETYKVDNYDLILLCKSAIYRSSDFPIDKLSRWLGFIQGVLVAKGKLTVLDERNYSRPLFHIAYEIDGHDIPPTLIERS